MPCAASAQCFPIPLREGAKRVSLFFLVTALPTALLLLLFAAAGSFQPLQAADARVLYVAPSGSDLDDCTPTAPCLTIQEAITRAAAGDEIRVAAGRYTASGADAVVSIDKALTLRGGFTTTDWLRSDPVRNPTVLDGEHARRGVYIYTSGDGAPVRLVGFEIANGYVASGSPFDGYGAGVRNVNADLTLDRCDLHDNVGGASSRGGGIASGGETGAALQLRDVDVYANQAEDAAAVYAYASDVVVERSRIYANQSERVAAVALVPSTHSAMIRNSLIYDNRTTSSTGVGGGLYIENGTVGIQNVTIFSNTVPSSGGGVYNAAGDLSITNTLLISNTAGTAHALYSAGGSVSVSHTDFYGPQPYFNETPITQTETYTRAPQLVDPTAPDYDLHLSANSPAIDSGLTLDGATGDFDGNGRPFGSGVDRGADEWTAASPCYARIDGGQVYTDVQDAVDAAPGGSTVKVAGTCTGTTALNQSLTLQGAYTVTDWVSPQYGPTILDAEGAGRVLTLTAASPITVANLHLRNGRATEGAGVYVGPNTAADLQNNVLYRNDATGSGGALYNDGGTADLRHNTFYSNTAAAGSAVAASGPVTLTGNIVANHMAATGGTLEGSDLVLAYNAFDANTPPVADPGAHGVRVDPGFAAPSGGDFHLSLASPLINAGADTPPVNTDFEGDPRPAAAGSRADIGADERYAYAGLRLSDAITPTRAITDGAAIAGEAITFTHTLTNTGQTPALVDAFDLTAANGDGWPVTLSDHVTPSVSLGSGESTTFEVVVSPPPTLAGSFVNRTVVTATSQASGAVFDTATDLIGTPGVTLVPSYTEAFDPGTGYTYTHVLTNTGPTTDSFRITSHSDQGWSRVVSPTQVITLAANASRAVIARVDVNPTASAGLQDVLTITAQSRTYPQFSTTVTDTTTANPVAGDRYVATAADGGDDTNNNCTQPDSPCASIVHAVNQAAVGDTVRAAGGTYADSISLRGNIHIIGGYDPTDWEADPNPAAHPTIVDAGGAGRCLSINVSEDAAPEIRNLTLQGGSTSGNGGALYVQNASSPILENLTIRDSSAARGGGLYLDRGDLTIRGLVISGTQATGKGGGIYVDGGTLFLDESTLVGNTAGDTGGGIYVASGLVDINGTRLAENRATGGAGLYNAVGTAALQNSFIYRNTATGSGGGLYNGASLSALHVTLYANEAITGGAVFEEGSSFALANSIVVSNTAASAGGGLYSIGAPNPTLDYNDFWGNDAAAIRDSNIATGTHSIAADPGFVDPAAGDLHLASPDSPCVDTAGEPFSLDADIDGDLRPINQGYDIGADELAGCLVKNDETGRIYGVIQKAVDEAANGDVLKVSGVCRGVQPRDAGGETLTQTVFIDKPLTLMGGYRSDFDPDTFNPAAHPTIVDAEGLGRVMVVTGTTGTVWVQDLYLLNGEGAGLNGRGGGLYAVDAADLVLAGTVISGSRATHGGGIYQDGGTLRLRTAGHADPVPDTATRIVSNTAEYGGGLYADGVVVSSQGTEIQENAARQGGGLYGGPGSDLTVAATRFLSNTSQLGGGLYLTDTANVLLENNLVVGNLADEGGGLYNRSGALAARFNTLYANEAITGGAIYDGASTPAAINSSLLISNTAATAHGIYASDATPAFDYNDVWSAAAEGYGGSAAASSGTGNVSVDPDFLSTDPAAGGFLHLVDTSPVKDGGDPATTLATDIDGDLRPTDRAPDIGADEIAGCYVRNARTKRLYGNVQLAVDAAAADDTLQIAGLCRGVSPIPDGGETLSQTVYLTRSLTLEGGYGYPSWERDLETYSSVLDALERGRVLYVTGAAAVTVDGLDLRRGAASDGGAVYADGGVVTMTRSAVYSSTAVHGGGLYNGGADVTLAAGTDLRANGATDGGALYTGGGTTQVQNALFRDNTATGGGGAIYEAAGELNVWHSVFYGNGADQGGALYVTDAAPDVRNNVFAENRATTAAHALYSEGAYAVDYNDAVPESGAYGADVTVGGHSLSVLPDFVDAAAGDFHLSETSPVLDAGDPTMPLRTDVDGDLRPGHQGFDMGLDELVGCQAEIVETGAAYGSLQFAIDQSEPGQTVRVTNGAPCRGVHAYDDGGTALSQTLHITHSLTVVGYEDGGTVVDPTPPGGTEPAGRAMLIPQGTTGVTVTNFTLANGDATGLGGGPSGADAGGGLYNAGDDVVLQAVTLFSGTADPGVGGNVYNAGSMLLARAVLTGGRAVSGGSVYNAGDLTTDMGTALYENQAADGAAVYHAGGTLDLWNTVLTTNTAAQAGGALYVGGGTANVYHDVFYHNGAANGGAIYNASAETVNVRNTIFDGNTASGGSAIDNDGADMSLDYNNGWDQTNALSGIAWGSHHLAVDPRLENAAAADFHLQPDSLLIDAGDNGVSSAVDHDLDADPRPVNSAPDVGADEFPECLAKVASTGEIYGRVGTALQHVGSDDTVQVHGTCYENLILDRSVTVEGGYSAAFELDPDRYPTSLDGGGIDRVITATDGTTVTLRSLDVMHGSADDGGGLYAASGANVTLESVSVYSNTAANNGGGLYLAPNSTTSITAGAPIEENRAGNGGGVYVADGAALDVSNKQFNHNTADALGGGMMIDGTADVYLVNPGFYGNAGVDGGGLYRNSTGSTAIYHGTFNRNQATGDGGAVYNAGSSMVISGTLVTSNTADGAGSGFYAAAQIEAPYNLRWQNTYAGPSPVVTNSVYLVADPRLRGPSGDLYMDSPALDAMPLGTSGVDFDRVNDDRPLICGYDIGRDEYRVGTRALTWGVPSPDSATLDPGESVTYTYLLTNHSTWQDEEGEPGTGYTETVTLNLESSQGWGQLVGLSTGSLISATEATASIGPGETLAIQARVDVPAGTYADLFDTLTLTYTVDSPCVNYTDPAAPGPEAAAPVVTRVTEDLNFNVEPDRTGAAQPGSTVPYTHTITNVGNLTDTYMLTTKLGLYAAGVEISGTPTVTLAPGVSETVRISVTLTEYAGHGLTDRSGLIVQSTESGTQKGTTDSTEVLPEAGVRYVATNGQDSLIDETAASEDPEAEDLPDNNCTVPAEGACRTLAQAAAQAVAGDEIRVAEGIYTGSATLNTPVTVIGGYTTADWPAGSDHLSRTTTLDPDAGRALTVTDGVSVTVMRLAITGGGLINDGGRLTLAQLRLYGNAAEAGGAIRQPAGVLTVTNSLLHDNTATVGGGAMDVATGTAAIWHNTFYDNAAGTGAAVRVLSGTLTMHNNIVTTHTLGSGVHAGSDATVDLDYNLFYDNADGNTSGTAVIGSHSLTGQAPGFVDSAATPPQLDLIQGTPAQDAGDPGLPAAIMGDYADRQRPRPSTLPPDIGAYERAPSLDLRFSPDYGVSVSVGETPTFLHTLKNRGDYTDTYTITLASDYGWPITLQETAPYTIELTSGMTTTVPVTVTVPADAFGVTNTVTLTATSSLEPALHDTVVDTLAVEAAEWLITKTVEPGGTVQPGDSLTYTVTLTNVGDVATSGVYTVTDTLPDFTHLVTPTDRLVGDTLTWVTDTTVPTGTAISRQFVITVTRPLTDGTSIVNDAYAVEGGGTFTAAHGSPVTVTVDAPAALALAKTVTPTDPVPGDLLTYTLTVTNTDAAYSPALGVVITDALPSEVAYQAMGFVPPATGALTDTGTPLVWALTDPLAVGASAAVTVTGRVESPLTDGTVLTNRAGVTATNDPTGEGVVHEGATVRATNIITLSKSVAPESVVPGGTVTYTLTLTNTGTGMPTVSITDTLGAGFAPTLYITSTTAPGRDWATPVGTATVAFTATAPLEGGIYTNEAVTATYGSDIVTLTHTAPLTVSAPAWAITKTVEPPDFVQPGGTLTYTLTAINVGVSASDGDYTLTDALPAETHFVSATGSGVEHEGVVGWRASSAVAAGESITRSYAVTVTSPLIDGTSIVNEAYRITGGGTTTAATGLPVTVTVSATNAITLSKTVTPALVRGGDPVTYTIVLTNSGTGIAHVAVTDTLAAGFTPSIYTEMLRLPGRTWNGTGNSTAVVFTATTPLTESLYVNPVVTATYGTTTRTLMDTASVEVVQPHVAVGKSATPETVEAGSTLTYTIRVTNTGKLPLTNVIITDTLPSAVTASGPTVWTVPSLAPDGVWTQTLPVAAGWGYSGTLENRVVVSTAEGATDVATTTSRGAVTPAVAIEKRVDPAVVEAGEPLTYTIFVTNTGNVDLHATVTDTLPISITPSGTRTWTPVLTESSPGWQEQVVVTATWGYSGTLENHAEVTTLEGVRAQDSVTSEVVTEPRLAIAKRAEPGDWVPAGGMVTYTLTVTNTGSGALHATITDTLPTPVTPSGLLTWTASLTEPNAVWTTGFTATVDPNYAGPLVNAMAVSTEEGVSDRTTATIGAQLLITGLVAQNDSPTPLGETTTLSASIETGTNAAYIWDFGDGTSGSGEVATHTYPAPGTYTAVVTASNAVDAVTATTTVSITRITRGVTLTPDRSGSAKPGDVLTYTHRLTNTGERADTFALDVVSQLGWGPSLEPGPSISLDAGASANITVSVTVPNAPVGTQDIITVTATSESDASVFAAVVDTATVLEVRYRTYLPLVMRAFAPPQRPDLIVTDLSITPASPESGQSATVRVTIQNQGNRPMAYGNNFYVDVYVDREPQPATMGDLSWGAQGSWFGVGDTHIFEAFYVFQSGGEHRIHAQVDTDDTVEELREGNNTFGPEVVTVTGAQSQNADVPTLTPHAPRIPRPTPTPGVEEWPSP